MIIIFFYLTPQPLVRTVDCRAYLAPPVLFVSPLAKLLKTAAALMYQMAVKDTIDKEEELRRE